MELEVRLLRHDERFLDSPIYTLAHQEEDFDYLLANLEGPERGKWLYNWLREKYLLHYGDEDDIALTEDAIATGYDIPELRLLLVEGHCGCGNYGLALKVANKYLREFENHGEHYCDLLRLKAAILLHLGKIKEGREVLIEIEGICPDSARRDLPSLIKNEPLNILCRYLFQFDLTQQNIRPPTNYIVDFLCMAYGRSPLEIQTDNQGYVINFETELTELDEKYPGFLDIVREYLTEENWRKLMDVNTEMIYRRRFPSFPELIERTTKKQS